MDIVYSNNMTRRTKTILSLRYFKVAVSPLEMEKRDTFWELEGLASHLDIQLKMSIILIG